MAPTRPGGGGSVPTDMPPELVAWFQNLQQGGGMATATAIPGSGVSDAEAGFYQVYFGTRPSPSRGPALRADSFAPESDAPKDRGPAMHYDPPNPPWDEVRTAKQGDRMVGLDDAMVRIYQDDVRSKFADVLISEGVVEKGEIDQDEVEQWWQKAVVGAAMALKHGGKKITPYDWIEIYAGKNGVYGSGSGDGGPTTRTSTSTSVQEFDDLDARAAAEETYSALLGRKAKGREAEALQRALNAYAKAHPQVTTTTATDDGEGNVTSSSNTSGGISAAGAQQIAVDQARAEGGYAEYQAATSVFSWLQQALDATAEV